MSGEILESLKKAVIEYDNEGAARWSKKVVEEGIDPVKALEALTGAVRQVGEGFGRGELFLPDLIGAAEAMKSAVPIIDEEIKRRGEKRRTLGVVVIGTVRGDIHDIGKTMVSVLLEAAGFEVIDLGIDLPAESFVDAIKKYRPDILAMSALMTMTAPEQGKVIEALKKEGIRDEVKIMVGGGAITEEFAERIGADGYEVTAPDAAKLARRLMGLE